MPDLHGQRAGPADLGAGQRRLINNEAFDWHRVFGQPDNLHVQAKVADGAQARADEEPADVRDHDPARRGRLRGQPVGHRCERDIASTKSQPGESHSGPEGIGWGLSRTEPFLRMPASTS